MRFLRIFPALFALSLFLASSAFAFRSSIGFWRPAQFVDYIASLFNQGTSKGTTWDTTGNFLRLSQSGSATDLELDPTWTPAWPNIQGYYKLNESLGSSSVTDSSGNGNTGTASNVTFGASGMLNTAATFDGSTSNVDLGNASSLQITGNITLSAWINVANFPTSGNWGYIIGKGYDGTNEPYFLRLDNSTGYLALVVGSYNGTNYLASLNVSSWSTGTWYYVAGTYDGTNWNLYVNGQLQTSAAQSLGALSSAKDVFIGAMYNGGSTARFFNGTIDDAAIWNTSLSAQAIAWIYKHQLSKYAGTFTSRVMDGLAASTNWASFAWTSTLPFFKELADGALSESPTRYSAQSSGLMNGNVGLWHLDDAGPTNVIDQSGNSNTGTASNITFGGAGKLGTAATFISGANASIGVPTSPSLNLSGAMSMSAWVNTTNSNHEVVMQKFGSSNEGGYGMFLDSGHLWFTTNSGGTWNDFSGNYYPMVNGGWYHVAAVYDGSMKYLYVNGVLDSSEAYTGSITTNNGNLTFGQSFNSNWFVGSIDEAGVWNRALSATEILEIYRRGANRVSYQVRSCPDSTCSTSPRWLGPDGTNQTYFSELNNNSVPTAAADLTSSDIVQNSGATMTFANFGAPLTTNLTVNRYFQYRAILESDDSGTACSYGSGATWCSPELQSVSVAP